MKRSLLVAVVFCSSATAALAQNANCPKAEKRARICIGNTVHTSCEMRRQDRETGIWGNWATLNEGSCPDICSTISPAVITECRQLSVEADASNLIMLANAQPLPSCSLPCLRDSSAPVSFEKYIDANCVDVVIEVTCRRPKKIEIRSANLPPRGNHNYPAVSE